MPLISGVFNESHIAAQYTVFTYALSGAPNQGLLNDQLRADPTLAASFSNSYGFPNLEVLIVSPPPGNAQSAILSVINAHNSDGLSQAQQDAIDKAADSLTLKHGALADAANTDLTARIDTVNNVTTGLLVPLQPAPWAAASTAAKTETIRVTLIAILTILAAPNATLTPGVLQYLRTIIKYVKWLD